MNRGYIHLYCGDGKGKTTAATGLCIRAAGSGKRVLIFRYLKDGKSSENVLLEKMENISIYPGPDSMKFTIKMTLQEKQMLAQYYQETTQEVFTQATHYDVLFLDEVIYAIKEQLLSQEQLLLLLMKRPSTLEVILTGQNPDSKICEVADYISEIKKRKHPYDKGVRARKGIEF